MSKIIYIFIYLLGINSHLIFHFNNINEYDDKSNILYNLKKNNIIINIETGTPIQIIPSRLTFTNDFIYFKGNNLKGIYNENLSKTYKNKTESKTFIVQPFKKGKYSNDIIYLKNNNNNNLKFENFSFILAEEEVKENELYNGNIGLKIPNVLYFENENFIKQLKLNNYINDYIWTIKYNNENEGDFIIGNFPSEYDKKYKNLVLKKTRTFNNGFNLQWSLYFDNINWNNSEIITIDKESILDIDSGIIFGTEDFKEKIINNFFEKFYTFGRCKLNIIDFEEEYFTCKKKKVDITKFPSLFFFHKEFNYTFELDYNDLFLEKDDIYYFLIIFNRYSYTQWKLGKPFLKKYQFVFNQDLKYIGFYNGEIIHFKPSISKIIIFILIIIVLFLFIFLIFRYNNKKNKNKAQELIEDFETDYSSNTASYNPINET